MTPITIAFEHILLMLYTSTEWQNAFKWVANACILIGAIGISFSVSLSAGPAIFLVFMAGHILWGAVGHVIKDNALIILNIGFLPIDVYAMYIRL